MRGSTVYEWSMYVHQAPRYNFILCAPAKSPPPPPPFVYPGGNTERYILQQQQISSQTLTSASGKSSCFPAIVKSLAKHSRDASSDELLSRYTMHSCIGLADNI